MPSDDLDQKKRKKSFIKEWQQDLKAFFGGGKKKKLEQKQKEDNKAEEEKTVDSTSQNQRQCFNNKIFYIFVAIKKTQILEEIILTKRILWVYKTFHLWKCTNDLNIFFIVILVQF